MLCVFNTVIFCNQTIHNEINNTNACKRNLCDNVNLSAKDSLEYYKLYSISNTFMKRAPAQQNKESRQKSQILQVCNNRNEDKDKSD